RLDQGEERDQSAGDRQRDDARDQQTLGAAPVALRPRQAEQIVFVESDARQRWKLGDVHPALDRRDALLLGQLDQALAAQGLDDARGDAAHDGDDGNGEHQEGDEVVGVEAEHGRCLLGFESPGEPGEPARSAASGLPSRSPSWTGEGPIQVSGAGVKPDEGYERSKQVVGTAAGSRLEVEWIERARRGDAEAFRSLVDLHRDRAYGLALRIVRVADDAEEVAQDAFVRVWRALP